MVETKKKCNREALLILLCWCIYSCSYLGKVNYSANINQIMRSFSVDHSTAGMVGTFFFFAYGGGQILNGLFCKRYPIRWFVFGSVCLSAAANLLVGLTSNFAVVKYLWLVNGIAMSILWPCLIRLISEQISRQRINHATVAMGTTVATGTLITYATSALYTKLGVYRWTFFTATAAMLIAGVIWLIAYPLLVMKNSLENVEEGIQVRDESSCAPKSFAKDLMVSIVLLAVFAVATNLIKDGLTTWMPSIMQEKYKIDSAFSIVLTLALPMLAIFGNFFAVRLHKKIPDFVLLLGLLFLLAGSLLAVEILCLGFALKAVTIVIAVACFAVISLFVSSCNSIVTSIFPLHMKGKVNSGKMAGILNGFCYLGSTISSYGLGALRGAWGWNGVFYLLLGVCAAVVVTSYVYAILIYHKTKKRMQ